MFSREKGSAVDSTFCAKIVSMVHIRRQTGNLGEDIAARFLERKGFKILERNYSRKSGEVDIIALKDDVMHFVEVKAVSKVPGNFSREMEYRPEELVHHTKLQKLCRTASLYMDEKKDSREFQLDVVGVILDTATRTARCRLFEQVL